MAVNVGKTKFILFYTSGNKFESHQCRILYNDNEPNANNLDLIHETEIA
jgi:hypothetical protein